MASMADAFLKSGEAEHGKVDATNSVGRVKGEKPRAQRAEREKERRRLRDQAKTGSGSNFAEDAGWGPYSFRRNV